MGDGCPPFALVVGLQIHFPAEVNPLDIALPGCFASRQRTVPPWNHQDAESSRSLWQTQIVAENMPFSGYTIIYALEFINSLKK